MNKENKKFYWFDTGKEIKKVKKVKWKYKNNRQVYDSLDYEMVDGKKLYCLRGEFPSEPSPKSFNLKNFKKEECIVEERRDWKTAERKIIKQKPKSFIKVKTKIQKERGFMLMVRIKLTENESINFYNLPKSKLIRDLQLKEGDEVIVEIKKVKNE